MGLFKTKPPGIPNNPQCIRLLLVLLLAGEHGLILYGILKKFTGRLDEELLVERGPPGVETPVIPDVVDEVDADYILQGLAVDEWRRVRRVRRVEVLFYFLCPGHGMERVSK